MTLTIYIRQHPDHDEEILAARQAGFKVIHARSCATRGDIVVPRYSLLPFPAELGIDLDAKGAVPIYPVSAHTLVSDVCHIASVLGGHTPKTYTAWYSLPPEKAYVVKGRINSRKHQWNRMMFAPTLADAHRIAGALLDDSLISEQGVVLREYVPLRQFATGLNGLPITNEWRLFYYRGQFLCGGYYWSSHPECEYLHWAGELPPGPEGGAPIPPEARKLGDVAGQLVYEGTGAALFAVDVAEKADGSGWIVIEVNDGCQSGPSLIPPFTLYRSLYEAMWNDDAWPREMKV